MVACQDSIVVEIAQALAETLEWTGQVVARVGPAQMNLRTPCPDWDLRALVSHLIGGNVMYAMGAEGEAPDLDRLRGDLTGSDPVGIYRTSAARAIAAWRTVDLGSTMSLPHGVTPASFSIRMHLMDHLLHGWDLMVALGEPREAPEHLVALGQEIVEGLPTEIARSPRVFGRPTVAPVGAAKFDQLAALCGRTPLE